MVEKKRKRMCISDKPRNVKRTRVTLTSETAQERDDGRSSDASSDISIEILSDLEMEAPHRPERVQRHQRLGQDRNSSATRASLTDSCVKVLPVPMGLQEEN
jgi:hypothetical protein